ncbi:MAG: T9SS type A sorting domain-containing protein [Ferruginibacter sp.]
MKKCLLATAACLMMLFANAQWQIQNPGFTADTVGFYEMSLPDRNTVWAVCYDGKQGLLSGNPVLSFTRTTDGGATWIPGKMGSDKTLRFSNISAIDAQEAWVAMHKIGPVRGNYSVGPGGSFGYGGGVFHTTDAGITWEHTNPGELFDSNSVPRFVHFKDKNHGIAMGDPNGGYFELYITNNKGKKWKRVPQEDLPAPLAGEVGWISGNAVVGNTIWFGTSKGRMYKSIDFGKTWTVHVVDPLPGTYVHEIAFLDDGLRGVAHLRNPSIGRTYVFSTSDGGLTWTNYFQPANWKNSRVTAVPGTNAFVSTSTHPNPLFTGSSISYDVGQTWTHIDQTAQKAACRFFDAYSGYAGGFHVTGHPFYGDKGIFKSEIVFDLPLAQLTNSSNTQQDIQQSNVSTDKLVHVYPVPANNIVNISFPDKTINTMHVISIISMNGEVIETRKATGKLIQMDVSRMIPGTYTVRITGGGEPVNKVITIVR